jgi:hypothetical protein
MFLNDSQATADALRESLRSPILSISALAGFEPRYWDGWHARYQAQQRLSFFR